MTALGGSRESHVSSCGEDLSNEKAVQSSQIETLTDIMEKISVKNALFKSTLDEANNKLKELHLKLRGSEEGCLSLSQGYTDLLAQKNDLFSQIERIKIFYINLDIGNETLEEEHLNLVSEKYLYVDKVQELENSIRFLQKELEDKQCFISCFQSREVELSVLESQVEFLQEEKMVRDNKLKEEEQKSMNFMVEIFILQSYLSEMKGKNSTISQDC